MSFRPLNFSVGQTFSFQFSVSATDMDMFVELSGDSSRVHVDHAFARRSGFDGVVVYGSLMAAQVSRFVGMELGRDDTLEVGLQLDFMKPLYVDDRAAFLAVVDHISDSTATVGFRFKLMTSDRTVAKGRVDVMFLQARAPRAALSAIP
jgi:3-hydroxybutyryl-CoA dehydratase